jgi:hypothetical protein
MSLYELSYYRLKDENFVMHLLYIWRIARNQSARFRVERCASDQLIMIVVELIYRVGATNGTRLDPDYKQPSLFSARPLANRCSFHHVTSDHRVEGSSPAGRMRVLRTELTVFAFPLSVFGFSSTNPIPLTSHLSPLPPVAVSRTSASASISSSSFLVIREP